MSNIYGAFALGRRRGSRAYIYVMLNGIFISGVYSWLGVFLEHNFGLNDRQVAFALLGYGIPGLIFGPLIGKWVDRWGRNKLLPAGFFLGALSAAVLIFPVPLLGIRIAIISLSLGFDLTQPLLAGIISDVGKDRGGQVMSIMAFMLFVGFGLGAYLFGLALSMGMITALIIFSGFQIILATIGIRVFRKERFKKAASTASSRT